MPCPGGRGFFTHQQSILCFDDGLTWLMQGTMFFDAGVRSISGTARANRLSGPPNFPLSDLRRLPLQVSTRRWLFRRPMPFENGLLWPE